MQRRDAAGAATGDTRGWLLAIDLGSTCTTAATRDGDTHGRAHGHGGGRAEPAEPGTGRHLPSVVCRDEDGRLLTGEDAARLARQAPERAELLPGRVLVTQPRVLLGGEPATTADLVAAVFARVLRAVRTRHGGTAPSAVVLTHPARCWNAGRTANRSGNCTRTSGLPTASFCSPTPTSSSAPVTSG